MRRSRSSPGSQSSSLIPKAFAARDNESTNGLLRRYFPTCMSGTDISRRSIDDLEAIANALNTKPARPSGTGGVDERGSLCGQPLSPAAW